MKKVISTFLAVALVFNTMQAQEAPSTEKKEKKNKEWKKEKGEKKKQINIAFDKVGLSADQKSKAAASMKKTKDGIKEIRQSEISNEEKKSKIKDLKASANKELEVVMGKEKLEAFKKEMKANKDQKESEKHKENEVDDK